MIAVRIEKTPSEDLLFEFDVGGWRTYVTSPPITASAVTDWDGGALPADITAGAPVISGSIVQCRITGGLLTGGPDGDGKYYMKILVTTTAGAYIGEISIVCHVKRPKKT